MTNAEAYRQGVKDGRKSKRIFVRPSPRGHCVDEYNARGVWAATHWYADEHDAKNAVVRLRRELDGAGRARR